MISQFSRNLQKLNALCEIKEEFLILWQKLSTKTKQDRKYQNLIIRLLTDIENIKNNQNKELDNE